MTKEYGPEGFAADLEFIDDTAFAGMDVASVLAATPVDYPHALLFIIDRVALEEPDHPVLVMELMPRTGAQFRVVPSRTWSIENNLSQFNMDWRDYADEVDASGVFRGFKGQLY